MLSNDRQIHVPPHTGAGVENLFALGNRIEARYVKPHQDDVFAAVSVASAARKSLMDDGPPHKSRKHGPDHDGRPKPKPATKPIDVVGRVKRTL